MSSAIATVSVDAPSIGRRIASALPRQARPLYCRIYPFWFKAGRQLYFEFPRCQAQLEAGGGTGLLRRLGMTSEGVRHTYQELCRAWNLPESI